VGVDSRYGALFSAFHADVSPDVSIWMNQAQTLWTGQRRGPGMQAGENPAIRVLFFRLCRLISISVAAVFVFDGPGRPSTKRGKKVKTSVPHWMTLHFQRLIEAFGFHWYTVAYTLF